MSKYVSIITVTYINSSEAIASQALAENMMAKIALDNGKIGIVFGKVLIIIF